MRISKEVRDILADAVKGFKGGLRPVFNEWGDGTETACLITSANKVRGSSCYESALIKGWDSAWSHNDNIIYQAGERLATAIKKLRNKT